MAVAVKGLNQATTWLDRFEPIHGVHAPAKCEVALGKKAVVFGNVWR